MYIAVINGVELTFNDKSCLSPAYYGSRLCEGTTSQGQCDKYVRDGRAFYNATGSVVDYYLGIDEFLELWTGTPEHPSVPRPGTEMFSNGPLYGMHPTFVNNKRVQPTSFGGTSAPQVQLVNSPQAIDWSAPDAEGDMDTCNGKLVNCKLFYGGWVTYLELNRACKGKTIKIDFDGFKVRAGEGDVINPSSESEYFDGANGKLIHEDDLLSHYKITL